MIKPIFRIIVTILLLSIVLWRAQPLQIWETLSTINLWLYMGALLITLLDQSLSTLRWKLLIEQIVGKIKTLTLIPIYILSTTLNFTLPSTITGDSFKIIRVKQTFRESSLISITVATLLERVLGLSTMLFLLTIFAPLASVNLYFKILVAVGSACLFIVLIGGIVYAHAMYKLIQLLAPKIARQKLVVQTFATLEEYRTSRWRLVYGWVLSLITQILTTTNELLLFYIVGVSLPLEMLFFVIPLTRIVAALPISIGGIGVQEVTLVGLLLATGIGATQITAYTLTQYSIFLVLGVVSGITFSLKPSLYSVYKD